jgi:hypothetical protein
MSAQPDFIVEGHETYQEQFQADEETLAARGFTSDFCGAWSALWQVMAREYSTGIISALGDDYGARMRDAREAYMAVISAAVRADKSKSKVRRFKCPASLMWSYLSGELLPDGERDDVERKRVARNFARYWRGAKGWGAIARFQRATHLPFVDHDSRTFKDNRKAAEAGNYTDNLSDLLGDVMRRFRSYRGGGRVERFNRAAKAALDAFRRETEHVCENRKDKDGKPCRRPHPFAPDVDRPEVAVGENPQPAASSARPVKVLSFEKGKTKLLAGVEIMQARADAGRMTPDEARELIETLAPIVAIAEGVFKSSVEDGVSMEDLNHPDTEVHEPDLVPRGQNGKSDFTAENSEVGKVPEDKFIRVTPSLDEFLTAFFPDPYQDINLRTFAPKGAPDGDSRFSAVKLLTCREALACDEQLVDGLHEYNKTRGLYFVVNAGGNKDADITNFNAFFVEMDEGALSDQHAKLDACPMPPTIRVETLKSVHAYWLAAPGCSADEWRKVQRRLIHHFGGDPKIKNPSRVMRVPGFNHVKFTDGLLSFKPIECVAFDASRRFTPSEMCAAFAEAPEEKPKPKYQAPPVTEMSGELEKYKRELGERISNHPSAQRNGHGNFDCRAICHDGKGTTGLFYDPSSNFVRCNADPSCGLSAIASAFGMPPLNSSRSMSFAQARAKGAI